jgi:uncharacterized protein YndB with AHSA1/START domain
MDVTGARTEVELLLELPPERVWERITDVAAIGRWSPECTGAAWLDRAGPQPRPGDRFSGRNRFPSGLETSVVCVVTEATRPRTFAYAVLDATGGTSSTWRFELAPGPAGTVVRQSFTHGPGDSGMRSDAEAGADPADRLGRIRANMAATLTALGREPEPSVVA